MKNFIPINRNLFNHFLWTEKRTYSRFEAWLDLLQIVNFKKEKSKKIINNRLVIWGRGQYPLSLSFLERRWLWTQGRVRCFIKLLKDDKMITVDTTYGTTMITICNYDNYNKILQAESKSNASQTTNGTQQDKKVKKEKNEIKDIITHLNFKTGKKYKLSSEKTKSLITARLNDGFRVDDFKKVIDNKCNDWLGDLKFDKFLRPETLFSNKFEGYLNETTINKTKKLIF